MTAPMHIADTESNTIDLLCFDMGVERFALMLSSVEEIVDAVGIEPAPNSGSAFGVLKVRGLLLPAYDPTRILQTARTNPEPMALIFPSADMFVAVLVDGAEAVPRVCLDGLRTPPALLSADRVMEGVLRVGSRWVALINAVAFVDALTGGVGLAAALEKGNNDY